MDLYQQIFFTTFAMAFCLLHLFLFIYNPRLKSNLYFALFLLTYALSIFFDFQTFLASENEMIYLRWHRAVMPISPVFALLFTYSFFEKKIPRYFWAIFAGLVITGFLAVIEPIDNFHYLQYILIITFIELNRVYGLAIFGKKKGAKILGLGFIFLFAFSLYDLFMDFGYIEPVYGIHNGYPFGFFLLIIAISIYLARDFARISQKIIAEELKTKILEVENNRKSKELEDARQLQLSMLPQCLNDMPGFDICFDMVTATEVGGDYYDYHHAEDGTLTIAIGDATGHGMKAGTMVAVIKGLFVADAAESDLSVFFRKASKTIKQMQLGNLYMAFMLIRIKGNKMSATSAGMPPIYIFRNNSKSVEEILIKGMPLGGPGSFPYDVVETELSPGDVVLLMSDGLPERFNPEKEMMDYPRVKELFLEAIDHTADGIAQHLFTAGEKWGDGKPQDDDITFVVLKYTGS